MEGYLLHQSHPRFALDLTGLEDHIRMENQPLTTNPHYHGNHFCHMTDTSMTTWTAAKLQLSQKTSPLRFEPKSCLLQNLQLTTR